MYARTGASPSAFATCGLPPARSFGGLRLGLGLVFFAAGRKVGFFFFTMGLRGLTGTNSGYSGSGDEDGALAVPAPVLVYDRRVVPIPISGADLQVGECQGVA